MFATPLIMLEESMLIEMESGRKVGVEYLLCIQAYAEIFQVNPRRFENVYFWTYSCR